MIASEPGRDTALPQQALLAAIVASSQDAIISKSLEGEILSWNEGAEAMFGYAAAEVLGRSITLLIPPERLDEETEILARLRRGESVRNFETVRLRKDGIRLTVSLTSSPVRDATGVIVGASKIVRDITASKQNELALAQSRARLAGIVESAMDAIITVDANGAVLLFNAAACEMFGCSVDEARASKLDRFVPPRYRTGHGDRMRRFGESGGGQRRMGVPGEIKAMRADGSEFPVSASISHVVVDGQPLFTVIMRDLSELKQAQAARRELELHLQAAQKMDALGTLAGGVAHDFNNVIAAILGNVGLAREELHPEHPAAKFLQQIDVAASRARSVVRQILAFSRRQPVAMDVHRLQPLLEEAVSLLRATLPSIVRLQSDIPPSDVHVLADPTQIHQVMLNLGTNAWHALKGSSGRIEVGLEALVLDAASAVRLGVVEAGEYAHVWVADDGCGMDEATRQRIFDPFFTTKQRGEGTGLGLSVVHGIVHDHHGAIVVETAPGKGSTFHVYLPACESAAAAAESLSPRTALTAAGTRVLYIDDDEVMALMVERVLRRRGFLVTCSRDPESGLALLAHETFDVVVTDFNMPQLSGLQVAEQVRALTADVPVIITSGYVADELRAGAQQAGVYAVLEKEVTFEQLPDLIRGAVERRGATPS